MTGSKRIVSVVTGTNSNLGLNIAYRFLESVPPDVRVTLIVTSRTLPRVNEVISKIKNYHDNHLKRAGTLDFDYLLVDFTNMVSVLTAIYELKRNYKEINYVFINAAQGVYAGIDWVGATFEVLRNPLKSVSNPTYKIQKVGVKSADGLGLVFQANVFGPYYFLKKIQDLLSAGKARIIWISSLLSNSNYLSLNDIQLLNSNVSYEGSKRLVDLLHLASYNDLNNANITQYLVHPGIFISLSFLKFLNVFSYYGMIALFYFGRLLGSPWHNIGGYKGANAPIFAATKADPKFDKQDVKYGSACTIKGSEFIKISPVDNSDAKQIYSYFKELELEWDEKLKDQIADTRKEYP
ncbi:3-keto-steroid reductase [Ascoidea rubescens DSM 1968]|uniref:3beta-hydroxysteroid 3-dehydrogenase n=1 Tax=Ascoidea rubescens DSM 1968 TaxID=1344418 RepID=A0A1D2VMX4_9ASCO|nr:3-keto sterol reductase [Ascoidea rubescens DSM 1968]ODV62971.1 3-keto sterol reductase [Ascoidea rubescens DSM 1968]